MPLAPIDGPVGTALGLPAGVSVVKPAVLDIEGDKVLGFEAVLAVKATMFDFCCCDETDLNLSRNRKSEATVDRPEVEAVSGEEGRIFGRRSQSIRRPGKGR